MNIPSELLQTLSAHDQSHVLQWWDELTDDQQAAFAEQLASVDLERLGVWFSQRASADDHHEAVEKSRQATPPAELIRHCDPQIGPADREAARARGRELLASGRVGAILVAGGQGTRLEFPHPKGLYPIGPVTGAVLLDYLCGQIRARSARHGAAIPYYIMTSDATHDELVAGFQERDYFGLNPDDVIFFRQGHLPAVDFETGRLLLADKGSLALSPDGHGGMVDALRRHGLLEDFRRRGLEHLYYHQVDNPCAIVCDPEFLGFHDQRQSDMSTKVVAKVSAEEKMGVVVDVAGSTQIIEYSDMPAEIAAQLEADGGLRFWAGNTAIHAFRVDFLEQLAATESWLPIHLAHKKVAYRDAEGRLCEPDAPNALKFERFVFDALPHAKNALVVEADRTREFHPVKNKTGRDSPQTCRTALQNIWRQWLGAAGREISPHASLEIHPTFALDADELKSKEGSIPVIGDRIVLK